MWTLKGLTGSSAPPTGATSSSPVAGRRWRASDPALPEDLRIELVGELMAARRAVRTDPESARPRVQDAKVALGERGEPWWEAPSADGRAARRAAAARALARHRGVEPADCAVDAGCVVGEDRVGEHGAS